MIDFEDNLAKYEEKPFKAIYSDSVTIPILPGNLVEVTCDITEKKNIKLLLDTGATVSILNVNVLMDSVIIDSSRIMDIQGIFNNTNKTIGEVVATILFNGVPKQCEFQVISSKHPMNVDGILGMDFLKNKAVIDLNKMKCELNNISRTSKMEQWNKGEMILRKMGFEGNTGLGKELQGIKEPIPFTLKFGREGFGSKESNWVKLVQRESTENEIDRLLSIDVSDNTNSYCKHFVEEKDTTTNVSNNSKKIILNPRSECIVSLPTHVKGDHLCHSEEVQHKVYVANSVVRPMNGLINVSIINSNAESVEIYNFRPKLEPLHNFRVFSYNNSNGNTQRNNSQYGSRWQRFLLLIQELNLPSNLSSQELDSLKSIFYNYANIFHLPGDKLSYTNVTKFKLPLQDENKIVHRKQYRLPEVYRNEIQTQIDKLLKDDIIEPSISPYNNPILLVPKKGVDDDGSKKYRLCVDFRELNKIAKPFSFPLPRIEDILDRLGKSNYFTTLDLSQGFHQVLIDKSDREKTAFTSSFGHYQYKRCPFGLKTIPGFFQSLLNGILTGLQGVKCFVYLDDVVVFGRNLEEHNSKLIDIFDRLESANLKLNPKKCKFLQKEILYLGHVCSKEGVRPDSKLLEAVKKFPVPRNIKQLQSFLGLANYYRKFIVNFSKIAHPLHRLLSKDKKFQWDKESDEAFEKLKFALISPPVLAYPQFNKPFQIICDASGFGLGAILEQEGKVISYASRSLLPAEKRWSATELELNAIVFGCKTFSCYVLGSRVTIFTDHMPLRGFLRVKDTSARIVRLLQKLAQFDYEIIYKKGKENQNADCLSRIPNTETCLAVTRSMNNNQSSTDKQKMIVVNSPQTVSKSHNSVSNVEDEEDKYETVDEDEYETVDEEEYENVDEEDDSCDNILDPKEQWAILKAYHDSPFGGHFGVSKTYNKIKRRFKWKGLKKDVGAYVKKCKKCQQNKIGRRIKMPLILTDVSKKPFDKVYVDIVGPLPISSNGNKYILSMLDDLTRFVEFVPLPNQLAETVARALYEEILCRYTIPKNIVTDNGTNFECSVFKALCRLLGVSKLRTTPYHPQGNVVERQHSSLGNYLRNFVEGHPTDWDIFLRTAAHAYNNTPHSSTGFAPIELLFGFVSEIPTNLKRKPEPVYTWDKYVSELKYKLQTSFTLARENLLKNKLVAKKRHDSTIRPVDLAVNDKVLLKNETRTSKLSPVWIGPFEVITVHSNHNVTIKKRGKPIRVHIDRLKRFYE